VVAGSSIYAITKEWNRLGPLTPRGNRWRGTQVRQVLLAPRNADLRVLRGRVIGTGNWPAIVPEDIWRGVVDILADPKRRTRRSRARKHLLSGLALCGVCGNVLGSGVNSPGGLIYLCKGCNKVSREGAKLDALVVEAVVARLSRPDTAELTQPEQRDDLNALREQGPRAENPPRRPLPTKTREVRWAVTVSGGPGRRIRRRRPSRPRR